MMSGPRVFHRNEMVLTEAVTPTGNTSIARLVNSTISNHIGAGIEYLEAVTIDWTVTYDEVLFILEGPLTLEFAEDDRHICNTGDIVWLPEGTHLKYIAAARAGYFYALYPVDWAARQGTVEP
jgi:ethanolamine utilization protein EutQ